MMKEALYDYDAKVSFILPSKFFYVRKVFSALFSMVGNKIILFGMVNVRKHERFFGDMMKVSNFANLVLLR